MKLPNIQTYNEVAVVNVSTFLFRKSATPAYKSFFSAAKQELATKKGLASTVDVNLQTTLLTYHTKLESQLASAQYNT